jgi:hypothetical protein
MMRFQREGEVLASLNYPNIGGAASGKSNESVPQVTRTWPERSTAIPVTVSWPDPPRNGNGSDDMRKLAASVRERAAQLLAEIISRRSGAEGQNGAKGRARASGPGKEGHPPSVQVRSGATGGPGGPRTGRERQGPNKGSKADSRRNDPQVLDVQEAPEGKVYSLKSAWLP